MKLSVMIPAGLTVLALVGCASGGGYNSGYNNGYNSGYASSQVCSDCGTVTRIMVLDSGRTAPAATGAVLGGIVALLQGTRLLTIPAAAVATRMSPPLPVLRPARLPATVSSKTPPVSVMTSPYAWTMAVSWWSTRSR